MNRNHAKLFGHAFLFGLLLLSLPGLFAEPGYNPLAVPENFEPQVRNMDVMDSARKRIIPIRVYLPETQEPAPVLIFSHGLGGSREGSAYLGKHWAGRGYVAVFLQHPGSDQAVWESVKPSQRMSAMQKAANAQNFLLRVKDVSKILDQLEKWNGEKEHFLEGRLNMDQVGMSGHSFGAVTTQAVSGQIMRRGKALYTDPRIDAAVLMSPSLPKRGDPADVFGRISLPWLLMTGTDDTSFIGEADAASRLKVYPALPPGDKFELVLRDAEHSVFTERALPGDSKPRNPKHHQVILAISTAFWDSYLRKDEEAKAWLTGEGAKSILETGDRWQCK